MTISAADVKTLRDRTNAPMMECKAALTEAGGDMDRAIQILREKHKGIVDKRSGNVTAEGRIGTFVDLDRKVGGIVELCCESAPTAKNDLFVQLANDLARQVALKKPATAEELMAQAFIDDPKKKVADRVNEVLAVIRENMKPARVKGVDGLCGSYVHHDGSVGVLIQVEGEKAEPQLLRDVCMHITARNPAYARREDVSADILDREKEIAKAQTENDPKNKTKPANILEKIIEGKLNTWLAENVLLDQPFVKEESKTVSQVLQGAGLKLLQFIRYKIGETG
jgi:elongation factor Ts